MDKRRIVMRHSIKPKGEDKESAQYKGISDKGVELARQSAINMIDYLEEAPEGAVIFLGGASDFPRTKSTSRVVGTELKHILSERKNEYLVLTEEDLPKGAGYTGIAKGIKRIIDENPYKKIVVVAPLYLNELSMVSRGYCGKDEIPGEFMERIRVRRRDDGDNEHAAIREWIENDGVLDGVQGPNPLESAKSVERGIERLEHLVGKYVADRPIVTAVVGHGWEIDAYLTYAAGHGKISGAAWDKVSSGKGMIMETEIGEVKIGDEMTTVTYRGKPHAHKNIEHVVGAVGIIAAIGIILYITSKSGITGSFIKVGQGSFSSMNFMIILSASLIALLAGLSIFGPFKTKK